MSSASKENRPDSNDQDRHAGAPRLHGRVALVTGSSRGLGFEMARGLASAGAHVLLNSRGVEDCGEASQALRAEGWSVDPLAFDVADDAAQATAIERIRTAHGRLDILINNAAIRRRLPFEQVTAEDLTEVLQANLVSAFRLSQRAAELMKAQRYGRLIFVSSVSASVAPRNDAAYVTGKGGMNALMRALAVELGPYGVTCNAIAPGAFLTDVNKPAQTTHASIISTRVPLGRWGDPAELAGPALFLASDAASYVNGHVLTVDGGLSASYH